MYNLKRIAAGIRTGSDACSPVYNEMALMTSLSYSEVKARIRREVNEYLRNHYNMRRRYSGDYTATYDQFLREDATALLAVAYALNGFKDKPGYAKLVNALNTI
jgi:hypothetical protein